MAITFTKGKVHWNYFIALEHDMETASRYVEFCDENMGVYSIEFAHLLLAAGSEVDVVAKLLCEAVQPNRPHENINDYRDILTSSIPEIAGVDVQVPRYGLTFTPWETWRTGDNPNWWRSHNNVKHQRDLHYNKATLRNSLNALGGLLVLTFKLYARTLALNGSNALSDKQTTQALQPTSTLLRLPDSFYYSQVIAG